MPGGFRLGNTASERIWETEGGKARFYAHPVPATRPRTARERFKDRIVFTLFTTRSHDQYNTTIYGMDDRYRGVFGQRRVLFIHAEDIRALGLKEGDWVDIHTVWNDGQERRADASSSSPTTSRAATSGPTTPRRTRWCPCPPWPTRRARPRPSPSPCCSRRAGRYGDLAQAILRALAEEGGAPVSLPRLSKHLGQSGSAVLRAMSFLGDAALGGQPGPAGCACGRRTGAGWRR